MMYRVGNTNLIVGKEEIHFWTVEEEVGENGFSNTVAFCHDKEDAQRIADALNILRSGNVTVHIQIDGRDVAKAVMPHLNSTVRTAAGRRAF